MSKSVAIKYSDIAVGAKENFDILASESEFDTVEQLKEDDLQFNNYGNPCELYQTLLDGSAEPLPDNPEDENIGLWSEQLSDAEGNFETPITLTLTSQGQYTSPGFTFTFDTYNNIFCNDLTITWYRNDTEIDSADFVPDNADYFCKKTVENFDKVIITFNSINMPYNRLKLTVIYYGNKTVFYGNELQNISVTQKLNPISSEIEINTVDFTLVSNRNNEYLFQAKQPLSIYFNNKLIATTFIKSSRRRSRIIWDVSSEDYIGLMDSIPYNGGIYDNKNATELLTDIFTVAKVPYNISSEFSNVTISGYIPYTSCRNALMQVAFAIQAVVDTSNSDVVNVVELQDDIKQTIPLNRIMQGQNFTNEATVTSVIVTAHSYKPITEQIEVYNAAQSGTGTNIFVLFSEPLHDLSITNGTIVSSGANYAIINANTGCVLKGQKYEHTTSQPKPKQNPTVLSSESENVKKIENATLVSVSNIDNVSEKCYNWLIKTNTINLKIVEGKHEKNNTIEYDTPVNLGENIAAETEYLGTLTGRLISQSYNLNGNIIVKEAVLK